MISNTTWSIYKIGIKEQNIGIPLFISQVHTSYESRAFMFFVMNTKITRKADETVQ